ncbi:type II secretion system protein N [Pseudomonas leptonychotis]|uniref:type II secretion system protein N n=1 Tax=Pseudomonas leptonychotis TaxID=2448482 RepID=UPI00386407DF
MSRLNAPLFGRLGVVLTLLGLFVLPAAYGVAFWQWQRGLAEEALPSLPVVEASKQSAKPDYAELAQLFGSAKAEPVAAPVKESTLSLKLVASYVGGKGRSAAVIASSENNHTLYYQGDKLLPGVELVTVQARRVLIKRNGVLESVSLSDDQSGGAPARPAAVAVARQPAAVPVATPISQQKLADKLNKLKAIASGEI